MSAGSCIQSQVNFIPICLNRSRNISHLLFAAHHPLMSTPELKLQPLLALHTTHRHFASSELRLAILNTTLAHISNCKQLQLSFCHPDYMERWAVRITEKSGTPRGNSVIQVIFKKSSLIATIKSSKPKHCT
jgi:hypothetical protein